MDKPQILTAFNDHFMQFVEDIKIVFPDNMDIATLHISLSSLRKLNPCLLIKSFKKHISGVYRTEIEKGNISFFIENDYKKVLNENGVQSANVLLEKIDCLRDPIRQMNKNDQDKIMKYLQNLTKLSDNYN
jgi:hypothetical protein